MLYCILSYLFYAILLCFLHIGQLLDGSSVFYVILLGLLRSKKMIKIDSIRLYRQRQTCWLPRVKILKCGKRSVFSKNGLLTTCCAGHHFPDWYQAPAMEIQNRTPAADVVHPLQTAAFLVNNTTINQVNVNFTASQPDIPLTNLYYQCRAERTSSFRNNATELGGCASFGFEVGGGKGQDRQLWFRQPCFKKMLHGFACVQRSAYCKSEH